MAHEESRTEALILSKSDFETFDNTCEDIYTLTDREIALIMSLMRYAEWEARWENRDVDTKLVSDLEDKLLRYCLEDLVKSNLRLEAAITGQMVDLDNIDVYLTGIVDHTLTGLSNRLGPEVSQDDPRTIQATIEAIKDLITEAEEPDYTEVLAKIALILGAA